MSQEIFNELETEKLNTEIECDRNILQDTTLKK